MAEGRASGPAHRRVDIRRDLESARSGFHALVRLAEREGWRQPSRNPGWTNGEVLFHIALAFFLVAPLYGMIRVWARLPAGGSRGFAGILNLGTRLFNTVNGIGPRFAARVLTPSRLATLYDATHRSILHLVDSVGENDWSLGMYYPDRWDSLFESFMTVESLFHYPVKHLQFHRAQLAAGL
jgi:hypothetical protein